MTERNQDIFTVLNTAMLAALVIMNTAWHYGVI